MLGPLCPLSHIPAFTPPSMRTQTSCEWGFITLRPYQGTISEGSQIAEVWSVAVYCNGKWGGGLARPGCPRDESPHTDPGGTDLAGLGGGETTGGKIGKEKKNRKNRKMLCGRRAGQLELGETVGSNSRVLDF